MDSVKITWLGHSCFRVTFQGYSVILDPFEPGSVPGFRPISVQADMVLCSHEHGDHGYREGVRLPEQEKSCPFEITVLESFHDGEQGTKRGPNKIHVLRAGDLRVAHLGDLGCAPGPEQKAALTGVDAVLVPVGGFYTVDAKEAMELLREISPRVIIPMHYRGKDFGFDVLAPLEDFLELCGRWVRYDSDTLELTPSTPAHTAVLTY